MDWKVFVQSLTVVFLAELGDKTQLAALSFTITSGKPWAVFAGSSIGLVLATAVGVTVGSALLQWIPHRVLGIVAAVAFLVIGGWLLVQSIWFSESAASP